MPRVPARWGGGPPAAALEPGVGRSEMTKSSPASLAVWACTAEGFLPRVTSGLHHVAHEGPVPWQVPCVGKQRRWGTDRAGEREEMESHMQRLEWVLGVERATSQGRGRLWSQARLGRGLPLQPPQRPSQPSGTQSSEPTSLGEATCVLASVGTWWQIAGRGESLALWVRVVTEHSPRHTGQSMHLSQSQKLHWRWPAGSGSGHGASLLQATFSRCVHLVEEAEGAPWH